MTATISGVLKRLDVQRRIFDPSSSAEKLRLIRSLQPTKNISASEVLKFHAVLLYIIAYPDNAEIHRVAIAALNRLHVVIQNPRFPQSNALLNSGLPGSLVNWRPSLEAVDWLVQQFPALVSLDWDDGEGVAKLEEYLPYLCDVVEKEGTADGSLTTRDWMEKAVNGDRKKQASDILKYLVSHYRSLHLRPELTDKLYEDLSISVNWKLDDPQFSKSFIREGAPVFYHPEGLMRKADPIEYIKRPVQIELLSENKGQEISDLLKPVLFARKRETDPSSYANHSEIYHVVLDRGMEIYLQGMLPSRRLFPDTYIGYTLLKNGLPMAYGGGWAFPGSCEIGINIFDEYRGGESNMVFLSILRTYYHLFKPSKFVVQPYQFGADNEEGLLSGAYWFYYRLGFRSVETPVKNIARKEFEKIQKSRDYKTSLNILKKLASCPVEWQLGITKNESHSISQGALSLYVTKWIGEQFGGSREHALKWTIDRMCELLDVTDFRKWPEDEKKSFARLGMWFVRSVEIANWTTGQKNELVDILRVKGSRREAHFSELLGKHPGAMSVLQSVCSGKK